MRDLPELRVFQVRVTRGCRLVAASLFLVSFTTAAAEPPAATEAPAAATIAWPIPWEPGQSFVYETETLETEFDGSATQRLRMVDNTTIEIRPGKGGGLVQAWTSSDFALEVLEGGDDASVEAIRAAARAFEGVPLLVELDEQAGYAGFLNLDDIASRLEDALRPVVAKSVEQGIAATLGPDVAAKDREAALATAMTKLDGILSNMTSPAVVGAMLKRQVETFNAFTGIELEPGATYEAEVEQENPLGQTPIPSRIEFGFFLPEDHPGDVLVEWTSTIDSERGTDAVWEMTEAMTGIEIPREAREGLPEGVTVSDTGFFLFHGETGVPEMYEAERTVVLGERREYERTRMRLVSGAHDHAWADGDAATGD